VQRMRWNWILCGALAALPALAITARAETCVTQSAMTAADRQAISQAALTLASDMQANNTSAVQGLTIADLQGNFAAIANVVSTTAPHLKGGQPQIEQVYLLDGTSIKAGTDADFFCMLNKSENTVDFTIPQLPAGRYAFAMVRFQGEKPWQLSFLMRQDGGVWKLGGLYPMALTSGGKDGLSYWREARALASKQQDWAAWLAYQQARVLLMPAGFISSTHQQKLDSEMTTATPPAVQNGVSDAAPLVIKNAAGQEFHFTSLGVDDFLGNADIVAHLKVDALGDANTARQRNNDAMAALIAAHPDLRPVFHGVWIFTDAPGAAPYATESPMADIH